MVAEFLFCGLLLNYDINGPIGLRQVNNLTVVSITQDRPKKPHLPHWQSSVINITSSGIYIG
jgi:hypothetical protein